MVKIRNGMLAYRSTNNYSTPLWRFQLYCPEITLKYFELHVMCKTTVRLVWTNEEKGLGFQVMGFGAGIAYNP